MGWQPLAVPLRLSEIETESQGVCRTGALAEGVSGEPKFELSRFFASSYLQLSGSGGSWECQARMLAVLPRNLQSFPETLKHLAVGGIVMRKKSIPPIPFGRRRGCGAKATIQDEASAPKT